MIIPLLGRCRDELRRSGLRIVTSEIVEPISLALARQHLRLDTFGVSPESHPDDELISTVYLPAAREYCESISGRALARVQYELRLSTFPYVNVAYSRPGIALPIGPALSIQDFAYYDANGVVQQISDYQYDLWTDSGYLYPATGTNWPSPQSGRVNGITINYIAGYDAEGSSPFERRMPARYKNAILLMLGHFYENRAQIEEMDKVPRALELGVNALMKPSALCNGFA